MTSPVPPEAITAAERAIRDRYTITGPDVDRRVKFVMGDVRAALEAAAPHLAAAERDRFDALAALTTMIISRFHQAGHPGYPALRSGWEHSETVESWRDQLRLLREARP